MTIFAEVLPAGEEPNLSTQDAFTVVKFTLGAMQHAPKRSYTPAIG